LKAERYCVGDRRVDVAVQHGYSTCRAPLPRTDEIRIISKANKCRRQSRGKFLLSADQLSVKATNSRWLTGWDGHLHATL